MERKLVRIGVDTSLLVAGMHANHPLHVVAAAWLVDHLRHHELWVTHHSVLECYAVLTRLPGRLQVTGDEAKRLIEATIRQNMKLASLKPASLWQILDELAERHVSGGKSYDAFIVAIFRTVNVKAIATLNSDHFAAIAPDLTIINPAAPQETTGG